MESLSTEIDENIIRRLPQAALNALTRVSKGYHALTEPHLYQNIVFSEQQSLDIFRLFFSILKRNNLAAYIRSFTLNNSLVVSTTQEFHQPFIDKLLDFTTEVKDLVKKVTAPLDNRQLILEWYGCVYGGPGSFDDRGAQRMSQAALALILSMAMNLEHLHFSVDISTMLEKVLRLRWKGPKDTKDPYPFHALKILHTTENAEIFVLPSLEELYVESTLEGNYYWPHEYHDVGHKLRKLSLINVSFDPQCIEDAICSPFCAGLVELCVSGAGETQYRSTWHDYDFTSLSNIIVTQIPHLQVLEWSWYEWEKDDASVTPFGSFSRLRKLTSLTLDYALMTPSMHHHEASPTHLLDPQAYLPVDLESLHVTDIMHQDVSILCSRYLQHYPIATVMAFVLGLVMRTSLSTIKLSMNMESWHHDTGDGMCELPRCMRKFLPLLVASLYEMGVTLAVWRSSGQADDSKLLYEPGYDVSSPHLEVLDQILWTPTTIRMWEVKTGLKQRPNGLPGRRISG
jgi:hypothetical protein